MRLTLRHVYDFGADAERLGRDLDRPETWDALRETPGVFQLPATRGAWEERARTPELASRARDIAALARRLGARSVASYGVGNAGLELNLSRELPEVRLSCGDYTPRTVERLRGLFPEATVVRHDLRADGPLEADLHLMHRIDAELTADEWRRVLARYGEPILFVPALLLGWVTAAKEILRRVRKPRATRAGYFRTEDALRDLWEPTHTDERLPVGDLTGFLLRPKTRGQAP